MVSSKKSVKLNGSANKEASDAQSCIRKWIYRFFVFGIIAAVCGFLDTIKDRWYVFEPGYLNELANEAIAISPNNTQGMITHIVTTLQQKYPSNIIKINPDSSEWTLNNAGGAMGAMYIIHASITEYLIIFGTPLGTEGHTGLHTADDYFNILVGEQWAFAPGALEMERYTPGMVHLLPRFSAKQYKMHEGCWALEYARGWIPLMLPFGLLDTLSSTLDLPTFIRTAVITGREMIGNLLIGKI